MLFKRFILGVCWSKPYKSKRRGGRIQDCQRWNLRTTYICVGYCTAASWHAKRIFVKHLKKLPRATNLYLTSVRYKLALLTSAHISCLTAVFTMIDHFLPQRVFWLKLRWTLILRNFFSVSVTSTWIRLWRFLHSIWSYYCWWQPTGWNWYTDEQNISNFI